MYYIAILFLLTSINIVQSSCNIQEIPFSENKDHKPTSAVFIDESRVALTGWGECYILKLKEREYIPIKQGLEYFSMRISQDRKLLAFMDNHGPHIYDLEINDFLRPRPAHAYSIDLPHLAGIDFFCNNDLIIHQNGTLLYRNTKKSTCSIHDLGTNLCTSPNRISCHPTNNNFLCCLNHSLYIVNIEKKMM